MDSVRDALSAPQEPPRHHLPDTRRGVTRHTVVSWYERDDAGRPLEEKHSDLYVTPGFYESGELAEVFVRIDRAGSMIGVLVDAWCTSLSIALQYGVPAEVLLQKFVGVGSGGPSTEDYWTDDPDVPRCRGPVDYISRWLLSKLPQKEEA